MLVAKVSNRLLNELNLVIQQLNDQQYTASLAVLSGSTIGQHTRHILEFYQCFLNGFVSGEVDYDLRRRNPEIESSISCASEIIDLINRSITGSNDHKILLRFNHEDAFQFINSSVERELVYNVEHAIHHMAIIKIAIINNFPEVSLPEHFGIAPSTVKYQNSNNVHR